MKYAIWGINKWGEPRCWDLYCDPKDVEDSIARGKAEGWTNLTVDKKPQRQIWADDTLWDSETPESDSSAKPVSPTKRKKRSRSSAASQAS